MKNETIQSSYAGPPDPNALTLCLNIICPQCRTQRAFAINEFIKLVLTREVTVGEYSTWCEDCNHKIVIQIGWARRFIGWVQTPMKMGKRESCVMDDIGLKEQRR